jgi:outer membrane translocation and assembly module TamA
VVLAEPLTWTFGASFQQLEMQFPAARTVTSNSVINTLRFHQGWEDSASTRHVLDAGYNLRAATRIIASDFVYVRHVGDLHYGLTNGHHQLTLDFVAGGINGAAPLFERFVLGNASTLRGWNKFDLAPLGGDHIVHGAADYRYRVFTVFYDTGVLWTGSTSTGPKKSVGAGIRTGGRDGFMLALAFPIRSGGMDPVFIMGFNF